MILKIIELIIKRRNLVLSILALPALTIFFISNYKIKLVPPYPYVTYKVDFTVIGNKASYIEKKVTEEAEKMFNGLPGLLTIESETRHEQSSINLVFGSKTRSEQILLFIQEKMDRLKLALPSEVSKISIHEIKRDSIPDITLRKINVSPTKLNSLLSDNKNLIREISPHIETDVRIGLKLNVPKLLKLQIPIDQVWKSLQSEGVTYELGRQDGISFEIHNNFKNIEEIKKIPIGLYGNRPVRLTEVATLKVIMPKNINKLKIWINSDKTTTHKLSKIISKKFPGITIEKTYVKTWSSYFLKIIPVLLLIIGFQFILFFITFRSVKPLLSVIIFDILLFGHYFFWIGLVRNELTIIDMVAFFLTLIVGTLFWIVLLFRIRMYFIKSKLPSFIQRTMAQASLFSIAEYLPTFLILSALSILFSLPLFISEINIPSQQIMSRFLIYGLPTLLILLSFLPLLSPIAWIKSEVHLEHPSSKFNIPLSPHWFWPVLICFGLSIASWYHLPFGISAVSKESIISNKLSDLRGYNSALTYDSQASNPLNKAELYERNKRLKKEWMIEWSPTPTSLRNLSKYDTSNFQNALTEIQRHKEWGVLGQNSKNVPLDFNKLNLTANDFSNILVSPKETSAAPIKAGLLLRPKPELSYSQIFHSQLSRTNRLRLDQSYTNGNFLSPYPEHINLSAMSKYWHSQYKLYIKSKWMVLVFTFILISLYMNSFLRGGLLTLTCFSVELLNVGYKVLTSTTYHLDSLWLSWLPLWITLFIILVLSRITDVERMRGNDRDLVLKENEQFFATVTKWSFYFIGFSLILVGMLDKFAVEHQIGLLYEGILLGSLTIFAGLITYFYLFKLFYVAEDEFVEEITFRIMKLFNKKRF